MRQRKNHNFIQSHGAYIHYQVIGEGKPLVLLHGNGEDSSFFHNQVNYFRKNYQLILIDSRAHGYSTWDQEKLSIHMMAHDVLHVLDILRIDKASFLGFSDGANIALEFAIHYPTRLNALIAISGNIHPKGMSAFYYWNVVIIHKLTSLLTYLFPKLKIKRELLGLMACEPDITFQQLRTILTPTLIMAGGRDMIRKRHTKAIARAIPDASLVIIAGAGHMGIYSQAEKYNVIIARFLEKKTD